MNILHLTLKREPFQEILIGRKKEEYREDKPFWINRFEGREKEYTHILFKNGYSATAPEMLIECKKIQLEYWEFDEEEDSTIWVLKLGKIVKSKNIHSFAKTADGIKPLNAVTRPVRRRLFEEVKDEEAKPKKKAKAKA